MNKASTTVVFESLPSCPLPAQYGQARSVLENRTDNKIRNRITEGR